MAAATTSPRSRRRKRGEKSEGGGGLGRALGYLTRYPKLTATALITLLIATMAQLAVPIVVQRAIDSAVNPEALGTLDNDAAMSVLLSATLGIIGFAIVRGIFAFAQAYSSQVLSQDMAFELRNDIFAKIQRLSFSYHDQNRTGQLMIRATDDVQRLQSFIGQGFLLAIQSLFLLIGVLVIMFRTNTQLSFVVLPLLPIAVVVFGVFGAIIQPIFKRVQEKLSAVNTMLEENLSGIKVIKAFSAEKRELDRFVEASANLRDERIVVNRTFATVFPLFFVTSQLGQAAILYFGGRQIINDTLTLGEYQAFVLYLTLLFFPMGQLGFILGLAAQASASAGRIFNILDTKNDVESKPNAPDLAQIEGHVTFDDVSFRYFSTGDDVLKTLNIAAKPGDTVALLGMTGSGKTTVINLIPRFYDVSQGRVLIDGKDIRDVTLDSLREQIGIVLQETTLFSGTIRENIAFGRPKATQEEVEAAAQAAAAHDFIVDFPNGYSTIVGERGSTLSGGQKQRIAIARALLLDPRILIMDDSTSAVDYETEFRIQQALDKLMDGRTSFVIAQRISTVLSADQIIILDKGEIVARGTHYDLLETSPIYAEIYHSQLA